ncbi:MAG: hypothetical protein KGJ78_12255 [Alphaproteobacteria bacterium]|nr:hypothetical protein [Alphaproteobacteria bacterium]
MAMLAVSKAAIKSKIVLLGPKAPTDDIELPRDEGPSQSWIAMAQDIWGAGNLTPTDDVFASCALRTLAPPGNAIFAAVCHQLGSRLFEYTRESAVWIDAFEGEPALSTLEKRAKDKVKLQVWRGGAMPLKKGRYTHLAMLNAGRIPGVSPAMLASCTAGLKVGGTAIFADLVASGNAADLGHPVHTAMAYRKAFADAGLTTYNTLDLSAELRIAIFRGLAATVKMLKTVRVLKEPWRKQRLAGFYKELEYAIRLHYGLQAGTINAMGLHLIKKK